MASISIIIPVYNVAGYVRQCIMSVLEKVDERVEIIVVEDHSTDHSLEIVQELVSLNPDIRLLRPEENLGLGAARNLGISKASNEYVMFLDSDDFLVPGSWFSAAAPASANQERRTRQPTARSSPS